jgi:hypothetical protein
MAILHSTELNCFKKGDTDAGAEISQNASESCGSSITA